MDIREGIKSQFNDLGFEVSDNVLDKCIEICILHNIDEETFVETWTAYSVTNLAGDAPTVDALMQMERKEFANKAGTTATTPLTIYNKTPTSNKTPARDSWNKLDTTPKGTKNASLLSTSVRTTFSPASFSSLTTPPSGKYSSRANAGKAVCEFSEQTLTGDWTGKKKVELNIVSYQDKVLTSRQRVMLEALFGKASILNDVIEDIGQDLLDINKLEEPGNLREIALEETVFVGRVVSDVDDHLTPTSLLLEGSWETCKGRTVHLDLSKVSHYSLFPGQVVAVVGINPTREKIIVSKLFYSASLPLPPGLPNLSDSLEIVIASGPYTQSDSLTFEPLEDLMHYVKNHQPHVLVLITPLVDQRQQQLTACSIAETYEALSDKLIKGIVDQLKGSWTQVVVVASANDPTCLPVFPTPPLLCQKSFPPLHLVSDPCLLSVNGLVIGLTATDTLMHLGKEEISYPPGGSDRLGRLASHLLQQQSFYPLYPPSEEISIDYELWDSFAHLPITPHILIVPSNFRYFIKQLHGCLVVNPEHLVKGEGGGTFARLEVSPPVDGIWSPATHVSAQIVKI